MLKAITFLLLLISPLSAKVWRNTDGSKSFQGDFQAFKNGEVHIKMLDDKIVKLGLERLHPDDQKWVKTFAKLKEEELKNQKETALFANLNFADSKDKVLTKLKASSVVSSKLVEQLTGRSGLNGVFKTNAKIGPYHCFLYFDWTAAEKLKEFTLRSQPVSADVFETDLMQCWSQMVHLMSEQHGKPMQASSYPQKRSIEDGFAANTHKWRLKGGGTALVGVGLQDDGYMVTTRFSAPGAE